MVYCDHVFFLLNNSVELLGFFLPSNLVNKKHRSEELWKTKVMSSHDDICALGITTNIPWSSMGRGWYIGPTWNPQESNHSCMVNIPFAPWMVWAQCVVDFSKTLQGTIITYPSFYGCLAAGTSSTHKVPCRKKLVGDMWCYRSLEDIYTVEDSNTT